MLFLLVTCTPSSRGGGVYFQKPDSKFCTLVSSAARGDGALGKGVAPIGVWFYCYVVIEGSESAMDVSKTPLAFSKVRLDLVGPHNADLILRHPIIPLRHLVPVDVERRLFFLYS